MWHFFENFNFLRSPSPCLSIVLMPDKIKMLKMSNKKWTGQLILCFRAFYSKAKESRVLRSVNHFEYLIKIQIELIFS